MSTKDAAERVFTARSAIFKFGGDALVGVGGMGCVRVSRRCGVDDGPDHAGRVFTGDPGVAGLRAETPNVDRVVSSKNLMDARNLYLAQLLKESNWRCGC